MARIAEPEMRRAETADPLAESRESVGAEVIALPQLGAPTARVAILHLGDTCFESTVALAVALAGGADDSRGGAGLVTVESERIRASHGRRRHSVALRGFEPIGRAGRVTLLGAVDAEPASIAAAGVVPIVCVLTAEQSPAEALMRICPSSLLLAADPGVDAGYLELLAADLARLSRAARPRVLRYEEGVSTANDQARPTLAVDRWAALRLRMAAPPGPRSRANAEIAAALLARA